MHAELVAQGEHVSRKRVVRLMQEQELVARVRRRYKCTTMSEHDQPIAPNLLGRQFEAGAPNQRWVGDTTELLVHRLSLLLAVSDRPLHTIQRLHNVAPRIGPQARTYEGDGITHLP